MANQTPMAKEARLKDQLLRQLGFLERSAFAYDQGHKDEAIRMATVMRTLFCMVSSSHAQYVYPSEGAISDGEWPDGSLLVRDRCGAL
jgi:hypothetical protein